jgi:PAS domain S-box-containing protein
MKLKFRNTVQARLLMLALLLVVPAFLVLVIGAWVDLEHDIQEQKQAANQLAERVLGKMDSLVEASSMVFTDLVKLTSMRSPNNCTLVYNDLHLGFERLSPEATNISLVDVQGNIYCAVNPFQGNRNISLSPQFRKALKSTELRVNPYLLDPRMNPVFTVSYPVLSFGGELLTLIQINFGLEWLEAWQREVALPEDSTLTLFSSDGQILKRYGDDPLWSFGTNSVAEWFANHQATSAGIEDRDLDGITRYNLLVPLEHNSEIIGWVHLGYPVAGIYTRAYQELGTRLTLLLAIFFAAMGIGYWGSRQSFLQPLSNIMKVVQKIQDGDLSARTPSIPAISELTSLAHSFDRMAQSLQERESARLAAKSELQEMDARFRTMFESSPVGMGLMGLDRRIIDSNPAMCKMLGYPLEELIGQTPAIATHPDEYSKSTEFFQDLVLGKIDQYITDRRYIRKNGEEFWAQVSMSMVRDTENNPMYLVGVITDIDEQKKFAEKLIESEARFRAMFENSGIGIALVGLDRRPIAVNDSLARIAGRTHEQLLATTGAIISHPDDVEIGRSEMAELVAGTRDSFQVERRYLMENNVSHWVKQTISAVRNDNRQLLYLVVMVEDIDQQKKDQEHLRESEARFRAMYDNTAVGTAMMSLDRKIISLNQASVRMVGYTLEELIDRDPSSLSHPEDVEIGREDFQNMVLGKIPGFQMVKRFIRKDGDFFWGRVTYSFVPDKDGNPEYIVGVMEDITEQKLASEKLAMQEARYRKTLEKRVAERTNALGVANQKLMDEIEQRKKAEEALSLKAADEAVTAERTRLARDLHDAVTQTLFSASLIAEVLPELWRSDLNVAQESTEELRQLTRGALAEMRTLLLELRPAALTQARFSELMRQLCEALIGRARLPIQLKIEGERLLPPDVQVALYRIAQECLNNVFKYAKASKVNVILLQKQDGVKLEVCDNGVGFDIEELKTSGFGLNIMQERADAIGANLQISSSPGEGTTVIVEWNDPL